MDQRPIIPYLQVGSDVTALVPPFPGHHRLAGHLSDLWPVRLLFGLTLVLLMVALKRMKIFQAIKMGETV